MVSRLKCEIQPGIGTNDKKSSGSWATVLTADTRFVQKQIKLGIANN